MPPLPARHVGKIGKFTDKGIKALTKPGRHPDGDGLYIYIAPAGTKSWVQRIVIDGRRRDIGLGTYSAVSVAKARTMAATKRTAVSEGRDPLAERPEAKEAARNPAASVPTFAEAASRVIELRQPTWSNPKHAAQWQSTLGTYAFPVIGNMAVDEITPSHVLAVLETIWTDKNETATRVKQRKGTVMDWAVQHGYRSYNPGRQRPADGPAARQAGRDTTLPCHMNMSAGRLDWCGNPPQTC